MSSSPALSVGIHPRYAGRTVEWGHWAITFMERQPDQTKNFGVFVGFLNHGSHDGTLGSSRRRYLQEVCDKWIKDGVLPTADSQFAGCPDA